MKAKSGRSLICNVNKIGPSMDYCGTPGQSRWGDLMLPTANKGSDIPKGNLW